MPKITSITIQEKHKERCNIFVDGEFFKGVSVETVMKLRLKKGDEIDEDKLGEIIYESDKTDALNKAVDYLSKYLKTKSQVKTYLLGKGYSEEIVWACIDKLKEYGYVNDVEYAKRFIESTGKTQGKRLQAYKLMQKGVKKEDIENAYGEAKVNSKKDVSALAEKYMRNKEKTKENLSKAYRYLIGRGFSYEEVEESLSKFKEDF